MPTEQYFFANKAAQLVKGSWASAVGDDLENENWKYVFMPPVKGDIPYFAVESGWGYVVSENSKNKDTAWDFVKYCMEPENAKEFNLGTGTVASLKAIIDDEGYQSDERNVRVSDQYQYLQYARSVGPVQDMDFVKKTLLDTLKRLQRRFIVCGLTPIMLLFFIFSVVPIIFSIVMSFYNYNGFPGAPFVGLANYKMLFQDPEFLGALKNTVVFVLVAVVLNICISTFLAVLIKSLRKKGARSFFRGWMFLPAVVPIVAVCYVWLIMFDPANGVLNQALMALGMDHPINWLNDPRTALFSIVLVTLWCDLGYNLVILMSGLDNIPNMFLEAAEIDGANSIQKFFKITLPLMSRNMLFVVIMTCISYFQVFAQVQIMTQGGPENHTNVIGLNIYNYAFRYSQMGYASAMAVVLLGIILIVSLVQLKVGKQDWEY